MNSGINRSVIAKHLKRPWHMLQDNPHLRLPTALMILLIASLILVGFGFLAYWQSDQRKYDIRRPGQQQNQTYYDVEDDDAGESTPVGPQDVTKKLDFLSKEMTAINSLSDFSDQDLSDQVIQLAPIEQPSL